MRNVVVCVSVFRTFFREKKLRKKSLLGEIPQKLPPCSAPHNFRAIRERTASLLS